MMNPRLTISALFVFVIAQQVSAAGIRVLQHPNPSLPYGGRHITIGEIDEKAFGGKKKAMAALSKCSLGGWHMRNAANEKTGGEVLEQWDIPGWGKQWVIKVKSSDTLDAYADCLVKHVKHVVLVGPVYGNTAWHVTLYGENAKEALKSYKLYTADSPRLVWDAYYLEVTHSPKNGLPGSAYHLTKI